MVDVSPRVASMLPGYSVIFSYRSGKHRYSGAYTTLRARAVGTPVDVQFDPENPKRVRRMIRQRMVKYVLPLVVIGLFVVWVRHLSHDPNGASAVQQQTMHDLPDSTVE